MAVAKGTGQIKDSGFSRPYGPVSAKDAKKISDAIKKGSTKKPVVKTTVKPKPATKAPAKMPAMPKTKTVGNRKKVLIMPDKISPSKMTPAQKARYLKNPERYDG